MNWFLHLAISQNCRTSNFEGKKNNLRENQDMQEPPKLQLQNLRNSLHHGSQKHLLNSSQHLVHFSRISDLHTVLHGICHFRQLHCQRQFDGAPGGCLLNYIVHNKQNISCVRQNKPQKNCHYCLGANHRTSWAFP